MARRGRALGLALGMLALVACSTPTSKLDRAAEVRIGGQVVDGDGTPLRDVTVLLTKRVGPAEGFVGAVVAAGSLGLACTGDRPPEICRAARRAQTGDDGRFTIQLTGADTQGFFGNASGFELVAEPRAASDGRPAPATSVEFLVQREQLDLPGLRIWDRRPAYDEQLESVSVRWDRFGAGTPSSYAVQFVTAVGGPVWSTPDVGGTAYDVDKRVLEDTAGWVSVRASTTGSGPDTKLSYTYRSAAARYSGMAEPPVSRGAPCTLVRGATRVPLESCFATDGAFDAPANVVTDEVVPPSECPATRPQCAEQVNVVVDLRRTHPVDLVVVRGCTRGCELAVSRDGVKWTALRRVQGGNGLHQLPEPAAARYVRATVPDEGFAGLGELSAWSAEQRPTPPAEDQRADGPAFSRAPAGGGELPLPVLLVAVALVAATGGALGATWVTSRRATTAVR